MNQTSNTFSSRAKFCTACRLLQHPSTLSLKQLRNLTAIADRFIEEYFNDDIECIRNYAYYYNDYVAQLAWQYIMGEKWNRDSLDTLEDELFW